MASPPNSSIFIYIFLCSCNLQLSVTNFFAVFSIPISSIFVSEAKTQTDRRHSHNLLSHLTFDRYPHRQIPTLFIYLFYITGFGVASSVLDASLHFSLPRMIAANFLLYNPVRVSIPTPSSQSAVFNRWSRPGAPKHGVQFTVSADRGGKMELLRGLGRGCFMDIQKSKSLKVEADGSGGEDVFDSGAVAGEHTTGSPDHLVIMVNGIIGSSADWKYAARQFVKKLPDKVIVHRSKCNSSTLTFHGVDKMGERLAEEVLGVARRWPEVRKISFVAHSLGGLVARYAIGRLYEDFPNTDPTTEDQTNYSAQCLEQPCKARIAGLEPMNFITFATPHLGSRGNNQLPLLCGLPFLERQASQTAHLVAGRSGKHLFLTDNDDGKPPLLLRMVNDSDDLKFMSALHAFKRRVAYANANYDHMVGWRTPSIRRQHELPKSSLLVVDEKYPHVVYVEQEMSNNMTEKTPIVVGNQKVDLEEEMIRGLSRVPWERVDVSFRKSRQRIVAHSTIQVKSYWLNSDGADVVFHMIDNFLI